MTKTGKCEVCRRRKIKCDEQRPVCSPCQCSGRSCVYARSCEDVFVLERVGQMEVGSDRSAAGEDAMTGESGEMSLSTRHWNVTASEVGMRLRLKRTREAKDGRGRFFTFKPIHETRSSDTHQGMLSAHRSTTSSRRPSPLLAMPFTIQELLIQGLITDMGPSALEVAPFGEYVKSRWMCEENELAIDYVLKSIKLFRKRNDANGRDVTKAGLLALSDLREKATKPLDDDGKLALLHAVMMHYAAEQFVCLGSLYYVAHVNGVSQLIASISPQRRGDASVLSIVGSFCEDEVVEAILAGRHTPMEASIPPAIPDPGNCDVSVATVMTEQLLYRLPRLVCLARYAVQNPEREDVVTEAVNIAVECYTSASDHYARRTVAAVATNESRVPKAFGAPGLEHIYNFQSPRSYTLTLQYYLYRVLLCGLLRTLHHLDSVKMPIDLGEIEAEDILAAKSLQMCTDYALNSTSSSPLVALKIIIPLEVSFGCWHRLSKRQPNTETNEFHYAERMKKWHVETVQHVDRMWNTYPCDYYRLELLTDAFAGGPLLWWMHDIRVPGFV